MKSISGSKGSVEAGRYHISDPRTTFYIPDDKKIIVYMEWEGALGKHVFEALWKNPSGKITAVSDFKYETSDKRYGGYMEFITNETMQTGIWAMEARIDGETLGVHNFEVVSTTKPEIPEDNRKPLSLPELYKRASDATAYVQRINSDGVIQGVGSGFFLEDGLFITAFQVIDGASAIRLKLANGSTFNVESILGWNRWQDWAVLSVPGSISATKLPRATEGSCNIGDHCYTLNSDQTGTRSIVDGSVNGSQKDAKAGERLKLSSSVSLDSIGVPVINEYGEVHAMISGVMHPGLTTLPSFEWGSGYPGNLSRAFSMNMNSSAVPLVRIQFVPKPTSLAAMFSNGQFTPLLQKRVPITRATLAKSLDKKSPVQNPLDESFEYKRSESQFNVYVIWGPKEKAQVISLVRFYDSNNKAVGETKPGKINLKAGESTISTWQVPLSGFAPDIYRLDLLLNNQPVWRTFFKVVE